MAINNLEESRLKRSVIHRARAIVSREAIFKSRNGELKKILGRLKPHLDEDEIVLVIHKDALRDPDHRRLIGAGWADLPPVQGNLPVFHLGTAHQDLPWVDIRTLPINTGHINGGTIAGATIRDYAMTERDIRNEFLTDGNGNVHVTGRVEEAPF